MINPCEHRSFSERGRRVRPGVRNRPPRRSHLRRRRPRRYRRNHVQGWKWAVGRSGYRERYGLDISTVLSARAGTYGHGFAGISKASEVGLYAARQGTSSREKTRSSGLDVHSARLRRWFPCPVDRDPTSGSVVRVPHAPAHQGVVRSAPVERYVPEIR